MPRIIFYTADNRRAFRRNQRPLLWLALLSMVLMCGLSSMVGAADLCPGQSYDVGSSPTSLATGDFNGDGKLDLVTANENFDNVAVVLGDGVGRFGTTRLFGVGDKPLGLAVADFNGDKKADLVTVNNRSHNVSVLLGDGAGGFGAATNYPIEWSPQSVAVGDFNSDGKMDLAVASADTSSIIILIGDGAGRFGNPTRITHTGATFLAVGDFNRDSKSDLIVGHSGFGYISILLGNGAGGFGAATDIQTGMQPEYIAIGDFNADGHSDFAVTNNTHSSPPQIAVLLSDRANSYSLPAYYKVGNEPTTISVGDFNFDGKVDLGVANFGSNNISVLTGNGTGKFSPAVYYETGGAYATAVGDFNTDGRLDLAVSGSSGGKVSILFNSCNAVPPIVTPPPPGPTYSISGRVVNANGFTFVKVSGTQGGEAGVDSSGNYTFKNLPSGGTYTVTPYSVDNFYQYTFSPSSRTFTNLSANQTADFTQNLVANSISGKVTNASGVGLAGIEVVLNMGSSGKTTTDSSGNYSFPKLASGFSYRVEPASLNYTFTPNAIDIASLNGDVKANFTATPLYNITGRITDQSGAGVSGVFVSVNGPTSRSVTSDNSGNYVIPALPEGGNYTMSLSKAGYAFDPPGKIFNNLKGHQSANFIAIPVFNITGRIANASGEGILDVTVNLSGSYGSGTPYQATTTTYASGQYIFYNLPAGGTYTITPVKSTYTFQPANLIFNKLSADQTGNFIGDQVPPLNLILEESGPEPGKAVAIDSVLFLRDPFPVLSAANLLNQDVDKNTRVIVLLTNLQLAPGETSSSVVVNLIDSQGLSYDVAAEDVQPVPLFNFTQVIFRLPDNLAPGACTIKVKAHDQVSNSGSIKIRN